MAQNDEPCKAGDTTTIKIDDACVMTVYHTQESFKKFKEFFDYLVSVGGEPSTKENLANSCS